jgi:hypothetical protein
MFFWRNVGKSEASNHQVSLPLPFIRKRFSATIRYPFLLSLPERALRSLVALSGGLLREIGEVALPVRLRRTSLYKNMVELTLRFLIEEVGGVEGVYPKEGALVKNFLLRSSASRGIELLGLMTISASPIWVLAALADATGAGHSLIHEISTALKEEGLLDKNLRFETADEMLDGLERTSAQLASTLNYPPLDVKGLRSDWKKLKEALPRVPRENLPSPEILERVWRGLQATAREQKKPVFVICSSIAVSAVLNIPASLWWLSRAAGTAVKRTAGVVLGDVLLRHYVEATEEIRRKGFLAFWRQQFRPYLRAAALQFAPGRLSLTERVLRFRLRRTKKVK